MAPRWCGARCESRVANGFLMVLSDLAKHVMFVLMRERLFKKGPVPPLFVSSGFALVHPISLRFYRQFSSLRKTVYIHTNFTMDEMHRILTRIRIAKLQSE